MEPGPVRPAVVRRCVAAAFVLLLATALFGASGAQAGSGDSGSFYQTPGISPPEANDFSCKPSARHPHPVVLVHGTFGDMTISWNLISPALVQRGYCVFALDYGKRATIRIQRSARQLRRFIHKVRDATGGHKVAIVGHSQGGMMPRYLIKFLGGTKSVSELVGLAPSNHGTTTPLARPVGEQFSCAACLQQIAGSRFLRRLNRGDETPGRASYTQIETNHDEVVTPYTSAFLDRGPRTTNVLLQRKCPLDLVEHNGIPYDPAALQWVENALGRRGPANPRFKPDCV